jgi:thioredoxin-like negative regulator of GroEL
MKELGEADFHEAISADRVVVDFYTAVCAPCMQMVPVVAAVEASRPDLAFFKVDAGAHMELAARYGVRSVPTFIVMERGQVKCQKVGKMTADQMNDWIDGCLTCFSPR